MIRALKYINLAFFILMIGINVLANMMPLGHGKTGDISSKYPNLFTPAPITFSIWGIIYALIAFFIVYQFGVFDSKMYANTIIDSIGLLFIISCVMNIGWIFSWHYDKTALSMIFMIGLLISLIMITMNISPISLEHATNTKNIPLSTKICIYAFQIYLGWIVAATIANLSALLVKINWNRFGLSEEFWTIIVIIVGVLIGMLFIITTNNYMSSVAIIWAYCGILIKHISQSGYGGSYPLIIAITIIGIFVILITGIIRAISNIGEIA